MNIKKLSSILLVTIFSASTIYAEPCVNCVATILPSDTQNSSTHKASSFKPIEIKHDISKEDNSNDGFISLDNNDEPNIIVIVKEDKIDNRLSSNEKLYACDDTYSLVCDNLNHVCECV